MTAQLEALGASKFVPASVRRLIDEMIDGYVSWREECAVVEASYENWCRADREDRRLAFTAYTAALDREESAAASYRAFVERLGPI
jgi:hypothetical protein